jgi:hypothetical protein
MEAEDAQIPNQRRKTNALPRERTGRTTSSLHTDGFDEGFNLPRPQSTAVRRAVPTGPGPQGIPTGPTPTVRRRQPPPPTTHQFSPPRPPQKSTPLPQTQVPRPNLAVWLKDKHWLFLIGLGMVSTILLTLIGSALLSWGTQRFNDARYGNPRTYQVDMVVGHGGDSQQHPSHFIAMNLNNQAIVIELKAGDPAKIVTYKAPISPTDAGQSPVTLTFKDVNGDHKLDMVIDIHLPSQDQLSYFINDNDQFRPATSTDNIQP